MPPPIPKGNLVSPVVTDPTGKLYLISCDAAGNLLTTALTDALKKADLVFNAAGELIVSGVSPSLYKPLNKLGSFANAAMPAGTSSQYCVTVPAGEYWRLTGACVRYTGTILNVKIEAFVYAGALYGVFLNVSPVVSGMYYSCMCNILVPPAKIIGATIYNATLNDDFNMSWFAERVY